MDLIIHKRRQATRRILWKWGNWMSTVNRLEKELAAAQVWLQDARITLKAQNMDGMPHAHGKKTDLADVMELLEKREASYAELVSRIEAEIADTLRLRNSIEVLVNELPPLRKSIIEYRYMDGHSLHFTAIKLEKSEDYVKHEEGKAVDYIAEKILIDSTL